MTCVRVFLDVVVFLVKDFSPTISRRSESKSLVTITLIEKTSRFIVKSQRKTQKIWVVLRQDLLQKHRCFLDCSWTFSDQRWMANTICYCGWKTTYKVIILQSSNKLFPFNNFRGKVKIDFVKLRWWFQQKTIEALWWMIRAPLKRIPLYVLRHRRS